MPESKNARMKILSMQYSSIHVFKYVRAKSPRSNNPNLQDSTMYKYRNAKIKVSNKQVRKNLVMQNYSNNHEVLLIEV